VEIALSRWRKKIHRREMREREREGEISNLMIHMFTVFCKNLNKFKMFDF
jgi:hypothetical protein